MKCCPENTLCLISKFFGHMPEVLFHQFCIKIFAFLPEINDTDIWEKNFWANNDGLKIHFHYNEKDEPILKTACNIYDIGSVILMWKFMEFIRNESESLKMSQWPGFTTDIALFCPVCIMGYIEEPTYWILDDQLAISNHEVKGRIRSCQKCGEIPSGFLNPIFTGNCYI